MVAVGVNCTSPEFVGDLILVAKSITAKPIVVYPNRGGGWDPVAKRWLGAKGGAWPIWRPTGGPRART